jgi:CrcB protein
VTAVLWVAAGGAVGSVLRYLVSDALNRRDGPWGTIVVNLVGSLALGIVIGWYAERSADSLVRITLGVGVLGGFTTFSAWTVETIDLLDRSKVVPGLLNLGLPIVGGLLAAAGGLALGRSL